MQDNTTTKILAAVPMPAIMIGLDERMVSLNQDAQSMFGTMLEGRHYVTALRKPILLDGIEEALRLNQVRKLRYLTSGHNRDAAYDVIIAPVENIGVLMTFADVTERVTAGQMRRDFVANVSHELKTPLTALLGFIETLRGAARDDPSARDRFLGIMEREAERMNRLVRDLLSLSRVESEERLRPSSTLDITALVLSAAQTLRPVADEAGISLQVTGADGPVNVQGDADQLLQVFMNLIENAVKYGGSGGEVLVKLTQIEREVAFRGPAIRIDVIDKGEGFDPVHIPRLTERFYRVDSHRSREMGGTGLGLAIVKHIINRHRGRFRIESALGQGSCFSVILPKV